MSKASSKPPPDPRSVAALAVVLQFTEETKGMSAADRASVAATVERDMKQLKDEALEEHVRNQ